MTKVRTPIIQSGPHIAGRQQAGFQHAGLQHAGLAVLASAVLKRAATFFAGLVALVPATQARLVPVRVSVPDRRMPDARCSMR